MAFGFLLYERLCKFATEQFEFASRFSCFGVPGNIQYEEKHGLHSVGICLAKFGCYLVDFMKLTAKYL